MFKIQFLKLRLEVFLQLKLNLFQRGHNFLTLTVHFIVLECVTFLSSAPKQSTLHIDVLLPVNTLALSNVYWTVHHCNT